MQRSGSKVGPPSPSPKKKQPAPERRFEALLEKLPGNLGWTIIRVPFDPARVWSERNGMRVRGVINGHPFRSSLFGFTGGGGHFLLINKQMQKAARVTLGNAAEVTLQPDLEPRLSPVPPELGRLLRQDRDLKKFYLALSPSARADIARTIAEPKTAEVRTRRAEQMAERLTLTMEAEHTLPPILQVAFSRNPLARNGWEAMTQAQRRSHLLGIFYYQSPEARQRRAAKAVEAALEVALEVASKPD